MQTKKWSFSQIKSCYLECLNLKSLIQRINEESWKSGQVICEIRLNGRFLSEEEEIELGEMSVEEIQTLEVTTQSTDELIKNSVQSYLQLIPQIKKAAIDCSEDFREYKMKEGQTLFTDVLDGCRWMTDALFLLKNSMKEWDGFLELGPEWAHLESQYSNVVNELVQAYESNDTLLLADVLEYELSNSLDGWASVFVKIDSKIL